MNLLEKFELSYEKAIEGINHFKNLNDQDGFSTLTNWMLQHEGCSYLQEIYQSLYTAEDFYSVLISLENAFYKKRLTFVSVNEEPRIIFINYLDYHDFSFFIDECVLFDIEKSLREESKDWGDFKTIYEVKILDIKISEFGLFYDKYLENHKKELEENG